MSYASVQNKLVFMEVMHVSHDSINICNALHLPPGLGNVTHNPGLQRKRLTFPVHPDARTASAENLE